MTATHLLLWVLLVTYSLELIGRACWIGSGEFPARTPRGVAADFVWGAVFLAWIAVVLFG
jgi:hypothetical protein